MKKGFTLIELLVVIAIIAILAAILFPVFAQAKVAAQRTAGLSQMKQIGTALAIYTNDYNGGMPTWNTCLATYQGANPADPQCENIWLPTNSWDALLSPYVRNGQPEQAIWNGIWHSPGAEYGPEQGRSIGFNQLLMWDITQNTSSVWDGRYYWANENRIERVSNTVFVADGGVAGRLDPSYFLNTYRDNFVTPLAPLEWAAPWRYGKQGANYVFSDSHARFERGDTMYPNPGHDFGSIAGWPVEVYGQTYCAAAKYQAPDAGMKAPLIAAAEARGVPCQDAL